MSTRCRIGIYDKGKDTIKSIYCHHDGYPQYMLDMLTTNYNDDGKVTELIELGDCSSIHKYISAESGEHTFDNPQRNVTIAYHRDRGEDWNYTKPITLAKKDFFEMCDEDFSIEYSYVFVRGYGWVHCEY